MGPNLPVPPAPALRKKAKPPARQWGRERERAPSSTATTTAAAAARGGGDEAEAAGGSPRRPAAVHRTQGKFTAAAHSLCRRLVFRFASPPKVVAGICLTFSAAAAGGGGGRWVQVELEQYATGPHIASRMLYTVVVASCSDSPCSFLL